MGRAGALASPSGEGLGAVAGEPVNKERHLSLEDAVDFVRGLASGERLREMLRHLAGGCAECQQLVDSWRSVAAGMRRDDVEYEPPAHLIRMARAAFAVEKPRGEFARAAETAKLVFDSRFAALPVGVRHIASGATEGRKLLFETNELIFDVQVQPAAEPAKTVVIGQVVRPLLSKDGELSVTAVLLSSREQPIASTTTNRFGEFQLEFDNAAVLSLTVDVNGAAIVIPLDAEAPDATDRSKRSRPRRVKKTH